MARKRMKSTSSSPSKWMIFLVILGLQDLPNIYGFTHWVVTEEGKIEAQVRE